MNRYGMKPEERVWEECEHGIWLSPCPICRDLKEAALLGAFLRRWEDYIEVMSNIREIKNLAIQIGDRIPPEWMEDFVGVQHGPTNFTA